MSGAELLEQDGLWPETLKKPVFNIGDRVAIRLQDGYSWPEYKGVVVADYDHFFNVEITTKRYGTFIVSVNKRELYIRYGSAEARKAG